VDEDYGRLARTSKTKRSCRNCALPIKSREPRAFAGVPVTPCSVQTYTGNSYNPGPPLTMSSLIRTAVYFSIFFHQFPYRLFINHTSSRHVISIVPLYTFILFFFLSSLSRHPYPDTEVCLCIHFPLLLYS
jgi:hypothetical protein